MNARAASMSWVIALTMAGLGLALAPAIVPAQHRESAKSTVIPAAEAKNHVGERCTVEMTVRSANDNVRRQSVYLDSEARFNDPNNLAVVISYRDAAAFRDAGIVKPAEHYRGKVIRVTGKVVREERANQTRVYVTDPTQIEIVGDKSNNAAMP